MSFDYGQSRSVLESANDPLPSGGVGIPSGLETGTILRERREAMGVTLEEAEASIRIRQKYLAAMEADEWHLLPGEIVGRGFLRNYAAYLDLEPEELLERRRSIIEPRLAAALRNTSAGAALPPIRDVNYDPKELELKDEPEGIEGTSFNFRGLIPILALLLLAYIIWQGFGFIQSTVGAVAEGIQTQLEEFRESVAQQAAENAAQSGQNQGVVSTGSGADSAGNGGNGSPATVGDLQNGAGGQDSTGGQDGSSGENGAAENAETNGADNNNQNQPQSGVIVATPTPVQPTPIPPTPVPPTPIPPTPVPPTPIPAPPTPIPEPPTPEPVVIEPTCPDARSIITSPGVNQVVSGQLEIIGSATHEAFQFYKLEYAPGANASGGWAYFDGANNQVAQGRIGTLDTLSLANGVYTIQLVVVDLSANFPPPCRVSFTIQN